MLGASCLWAGRGDRGKAASQMTGSMVQDGRGRYGDQDLWGQDVREIVEGLGADWEAGGKPALGRTLSAMRRT